MSAFGCRTFQIGYRFINRVDNIRPAACTDSCDAGGYALTVRADGESQSRLLAGGLTEDCAHALAAEIGRAIDAERVKLTA